MLSLFCIIAINSNKFFYLHIGVLGLNHRDTTLKDAMLYFPNICVLVGCDAASLALYLPAHVVWADQ
jgi:hypothetical protein